MVNGGYIIIDLKDNSISDTPVTISGIHEAIEGSHRKPLLLSGIVLDGVEKNDVFIQVITVSGNYTAAVYGGTITITDDDAVTYTAE